MRVKYGAMQLGHKNVTYALKDGVLTHISDVESGLKCGCICVGCGGELLAKKGEIKAHHFAHVNAECANAYESVLHLLAKERLSKVSKFDLPSKIGTIYMSRFKIALEKYFCDFKPDAILYYNSNPVLFIEIAVTHFINKTKYDKIEKYGVSCIEVDLSNCTIEDIEVRFEDVLSKKSKWIFNKKDYNKRVKQRNINDMLSFVPYIEKLAATTKRQNFYVIADAEGERIVKSGYEMQHGQIMYHVWRTDENKVVISFFRDTRKIDVMKMSII